MKKPAPWPSREDGWPRGVLAMNTDELSAVIRDSPVPTPEEKAEAEAEAQWEAKLHKAIASGEIGRERPGRKPGKSKVRDAYRPVAEACLREAGGRSGKAKKAFIDRICALGNVTPGTAKNRWYGATEPYGRTRRPR